MADRSDHLIERAAALLRSANAGQVVRAPLGNGAALGTEPVDGSDRVGAERSLNPSNHVRRALPKKFIENSSQVLQPDAERAVTSLRKLSKQAAVPISAMERAGLMVARLNRTRTTEEYRIVIGRLLRALHEVQEAGVVLGPDASANVVMVTSARPGEGKSFTSLNLGGSIAQNAGESVLIIDVDAKNNSLSDTLGLTDRPGFLDMVADSTLSPDDLIVPSDLPNLSFLALGNRSLIRGSDDGGIIEERRLTPPIRRLAQRFPRTLILLDAPPCLSTSDPHTLSPAVGQVVIVVEAERTQRSDVEAAIDMIKICPTVTMLLNKVRMTSSHTFGTYDYFGSYT